MGPTARFSTVLRPWRARRGKGCARSSEIKFFLSLRTIGRVRREKRERERSQGPGLESELISWHAVHLVVYSVLSYSFPLSLSLLFLSSSSLAVSLSPNPRMWQDWSTDGISVPRGHQFRDSRFFR